MTFVAQIKADASGFTTTVDQAATRLTNLEEKASQWAAVAKAAAEQAAAAQIALNEKLSGSASAFDQLSQAIKREQDMLDKINGPMQRYEQNLQTLDSLLGKNKISTEQYAEQVRKLNAEIERGSSIKMTEPAPTDWTAHIKDFPSRGLGGGATEAGEGSGVLGKLGSKVGGLTGAGLLMAGGEAYAGIEAAKELMELSDGYTETGNKLRSLSKDQDDFNNLMKQTLSIAQDSRMDWDATASVFQRLDNATRSLNLSEQQVLNLTKELSEASKLSGASSQEATMSMIELSHAFSLGTLMGQSFKVLMRDSPVMMHELQVASGMTQAAFEQLGLSGQITAQNLVQWFGSAAPSIQQKFAQTRSTWAEMWTGMKNDSEEAVGWVGDQFTTIGGWGVSAWHGIDDAWSHYVTHVKSSSDIVQEIAAQADEITKLNASIAASNAAIVASDEAWIKLDGVIGGTIHNIESGSGALTAFGVAAKHVIDVLAPLYGIQVDGAKAVAAADESRVAMERNLAVAQATISKLGGAGNFGALTGSAAATLEKALEDQAKYEALLKGYGDAVAAVKVQEVQRTEAIRELNAALQAGVDKGGISRAEYDKAIKQYEDHSTAVHKLTASEQAEKQILDQLHGASDRYNLDVAALGELLDHNKIGIDEYITKLHELSDAYTKSDTALKMSALSARGGITGELGFQVGAPQAGPTSLPYETATGSAFPTYQDPAKLTEQWRKELEQFNAETKKTEEQLKTLFQPLVGAINDFFRTGQFNLQQLGGQLLDTAEQYIMKMAEMWALSGLAGMFHSAPNAFGAGGPLSGSVFGALMGGLPGFATGGDVTVGGSGGTDSQIFMARVTPNEHISIRRPDQMAAEQQAKPTQVTVIDGRDPRAITSAWAQSSEFERHVLRINRKHGFKQN